FLLKLRRPPSPTLFPYTTLFRSRRGSRDALRRRTRSRAERRDSRGQGGPRRDRNHREGKLGPSDAAVRPEPGGVVVASPSRSRRSEEHTSELQSRFDLVCRLLLE